MRDVLPAIDRWIERGERFAVAVVTATWGSSPRPVGSALAVSESGESSGSVSGGCVEAAVVESALRVIQSCRAERLTFDAVSPDELWKIGLSCGGQIEVWVFPPDAAWFDAADSVRRRVAYSLGLANPDGGEPFPWVLDPPDRLIVIGGVHIAIPLIAMAKELDFETVLVEPRAGLTADGRFTTAPDLIVGKWPEEALGDLGLDTRSFVVTLSHDPKLDDPALRSAMRSSAAYIGALGSRTTHTQRRERLLAEGFGHEEVDRIRGPVGLAIGGKTPGEIALSILAEIVQVRRGA